MILTRDGHRDRIGLRVGSIMVFYKKDKVVSVTDTDKHVLFWENGGRVHDKCSDIIIGLLNPEKELNPIGCKMLAMAIADLFGMKAELYKEDERAISFKFFKNCDPIP